MPLMCALSSAGVTLRTGRCILFPYVSDPMQSIHGSLRKGRVDLCSQVSDPRRELDEAHVGALHAAASLFTLEAGGPGSGTLAAPQTPGSHLHDNGGSRFAEAAGAFAAGQRGAGRGRHGGRSNPAFI